MKVTEKYGFKKPDVNEYYDVNVFNENMDKVDEELKKTNENLITSLDPLRKGSPQTSYNANDYTYTCALSIGDTSYWENLPTSTYGVLEVRNAGNYITQRYILHNGSVYNRTSVTSGKTWGTWKLLITNSDVVDNLTSTSTTAPLSANQGKVLDGRVSEVESKIKTNYMSGSTESINNKVEEGHWYVWVASTSQDATYLGWNGYALIENFVYYNNIYQRITRIETGEIFTRRIDTNTTATWSYDIALHQYMGDTGWVNLTPTKGTWEYFPSFNSSNTLINIIVINKVFN